MSDETVQAKQAVEAILAHRIANEDGFADRLSADAKAVVAPIIAEVLEDDGDLDFSDTEITVHTQSANALHFVVPAAQDEVAGFGFQMSFGLDRIVMAPVFGGGSFESATQSTCASMGGEDDAKCKPASFSSGSRFGG
jgi:hypothetical protein